MMRVYFAVFKLRLYNGLQYRSAAIAGVATQFFFGFVFIMVYEAFYNQVLIDPPMSLSQVITYMWLQQSFLAFIMLWFRDNELFQLITTGNIAYELCRPNEIYGFWYAKLLAQRLASAITRSFPILIVTDYAATALSHDVATECFCFAALYHRTPARSFYSSMYFYAYLYLCIYYDVRCRFFANVWNCWRVFSWDGHPRPHA